MKIMKYLLPILALAVLFSSCNLNKMVKNHPTEANYVTKPESQKLTVNGRTLNVEVAGKYNPKYFNKKADVVFQPVLQYDGGSLDLAPITLQGNKVKSADGTVINFKEGGDFTYKTTVADYSEAKYPNAKVVVNPVAFFDKKAKNAKPTSAEEAAAVKKAVKLGETSLAGTITDPKSALKMDDLKSAFAKDNYVKDVYASKKANLFFELDKSVLNTKLAGNKDQTAFKDMANTLVKVLLADGFGYSFEGITISGWASPEGELTRNNGLSADRTKTTEKYLRDGYDKALEDAVKLTGVKNATLIKKAKDVIRRDFAVNATAKGEYWDGFLAALDASNIAKKDEIARVYKSDVLGGKSKEQKIIEMMTIYPDVENIVLPTLRVGEMSVNMKQIMKTDAELLATASAKATELTADEILYAATLTDDNSVKIVIYEAASKFITDRYEIFNNLGAAYIVAGNYDAAGTALNQAKALKADSGEVLNNLGIVECAKDTANGDVAAKKNFEDAKAKGISVAAANIEWVNVRLGK